MTTFDESQVNRADDGKFANKDHDWPPGGTDTLDAPTDRTVDDVLADTTTRAEYLGLEADDHGWEHHAWKVTLEYQDRQMTTDFRMGTALTHEPTAREVLGSMVSDSRSIEPYGGDFADWGRDMGMDDDEGPSIDDIEATYEDFEQAKSNIDSTTVYYLRDADGDDLGGPFDSRDEAEGWLDDDDDDLNQTDYHIAETESYDEDELYSEAFDIAYQRAVDSHQSRAEKLFKQIEAQGVELRRLLGDDYDVVMESEELDR